MSRSAYRSLGQPTSLSYARIVKSSFVLLAVHILAICTALTIVTLNLRGIWVGKELTGTIKQDGEKLLALQLTSKLHELLILASLGDVLFTHILQRFSAGNDLPMAMLTAGLSFRDLSYLWSSEFLAIMASSFSRKRTILVLIVSATMLGVLVGPSSATAISPKLDDWMTGSLQFTLNATSEQLWPSVLDLEGTSNNCGETDTSCGLPTTARTLADNLFSFWGHETLGVIFALPEKVNLRSSSSLRNMNGRFRGPLNLYQPQYTVATVQPAVIADCVNTLRMIWYSANSYRCSHSTSNGICSYKDITWSIDAPQPAVYTACNKFNRNETPEFPIIDHTNSTTKLVQHHGKLELNNSAELSKLQWLSLDGSEFHNMSVGVFVQPADLDGYAYACSVKAQWADSTIQTSFLNGAYAVDGVPPYFEAPTTEGSTYRGRTIRLSPEWINKSFSFPALYPANSTGFDLLLKSGAPTSDTVEAAKLEAIIAVILAEALAQTGHNTVMLGTLNDPADLLRPSGSALDVREHLDQSATLQFHTVATGYAYGVRTASAFSVSILISTLVLLVYTLVAVWHLITTKCLIEHEVLPWRATIDVFGLTLNSPPNEITKSMSCGLIDVDTLKLPVTINMSDKHAELRMKVATK